jgi:hypothetical protein
VSFEPALPIFGVGSPSFTAISNYLIPVVDGQMTVDQGISQFTAELGKYVKQQQ